MCFPQVSGVSAHLKNHVKQAKNEKNNYRRDLTRMVRNQQVAGSIPAGGSIFSVTSKSIHCFRSPRGSHLGSHRVVKQKIAHFRERVALRFHLGVLIHVLRQSYIAVPYDFGDGFIRNPAGGKQGHACVP